MAWQGHFKLGGLLPQRLSTQVKALYWSAVLQNLALGMLLLFEPIYLWQQGYGLAGIVKFYLGVYVLYFLLAPVGANFATRHGFENSIFLSTVFQFIYYLCLFFTAQVGWLVIPAVMLYALQKSFYFPAYNADFARYSDETEEGREVSGMSVALALVYVAGPLLAGFLLTVSSWFCLFLVGGIILLLSNWPLRRHRPPFTPRYFSYRGAYRRLLEPAFRRPLLAGLGFGEELIFMTLWPVFMYILLINYETMGIFVGVSTLVMALVTLYVGKLTDDGNKHSVLRFSMLANQLGLLGRLLVTTPFTVFLVDAWSRITHNMVIVPIYAITYSRAKQQSAMDTGVFFEMSLSLGKILAALLLLFIFSWTISWGVIWLVAAGLALFYAVL